MTVIVFKIVALIFQGIKRLIFNLPPGPTTPHEVKDIALVHPQVCHPAEVLDLGITNLPVLDEIDPHICVQCIERHVIDKPKPMHQSRGTVVPFIILKCCSKNVFEPLRAV